jgi:hypothetical protein
MKARAKNSGKLWTAQEDERLRELVASGAALPEIANALDRTESATKTRAYVLRLALRRIGARRRVLSRWG